MKQVVTMLLGLAILAGGVARAGVIVEEEQQLDRGAGTPPTATKNTVMVQGNKQKYVVGDGKQSYITDLDSGTRTMISVPRKMYIEVPFPSKGTLMAPGGDKSTVAFKPTGGHEKIAGYSCDDYTGTGDLGENEMLVSGCFSTSAPGAANFTAFQKTMSAKVKGTLMALMSDAPDGIPLKIDTTIKQKTGAGHPPIITHMIVTKVTEQDLPASTFLPPKDYAQQQMPMRHLGPGMMGKPAPGGAPATPAAAPNKVPE